MTDRRRPSSGNRRAPSRLNLQSLGLGLPLVTLLTAGVQPLSAQTRLSGTVQVSAQVADSQSVWGAVSGTNLAIQGWRQGTTPAPLSLASPVRIALLVPPRDPGQDQSLLVMVEYLKN